MPSFAGGDFAPVLRLLADYDVHRTSTGQSASIRAFQPRFDVREDKNSYQLQGELPGIDQKDIQIEFSDPQTLVIKGRVEREHHEGDKSVIDSAGRITEQGEEHGNGYQKPSVEDESAEGKKEGQQIAKSEGKDVQHHQQRPKYKYWVSERSVGEFHRSFSFPGRVDTDGVKASLKNGILHVTVPKSMHKESKRIQIE